jgi:hypothetical protein
MQDYLPVSCRSDEVEESMNTIIAETRITLDTGLLCKNIIVLSFQITDNLTEANSPCQYFFSFREGRLPFLPCLVVNLVSKAGSVYNCQ